ncbi:DUF5719 family protein [Microbacterium sp. H1-D42]|uniref:DUF5719 family protein n=1 Tax=Microbacterium sp. H1-D42 TaxID=2925844 RepID=UPI001F52EB46|nr:DUF5719 family protein [Microbacterium sp. H1-D42]UNK69704.1 DUF5719 family protein [Microbacterium sp. H1-D42]
MKQRTIRLAATGARIATGAVVAAACVLGVAAAVAAPWPQVQNEPATTVVTPVPGDTTLICNGSFRALGRDSSQADLMVSAGVPRLRVEAEQDSAVTEPLSMPDVTGGDGAQTITAHVQDRTVPLIAASESIRLFDEDLRGFAAAPCREASMHSWLVGGDVSTGASDIIVLSNPGSVPATVDLTVYGLQRAASTTIVPPRTQIGLPLASVAAGEQRPVVEVTSSGAPVRATLQSAFTRTLDAVGIDLQDGIGGAQNQLMLLGVQSDPASAGDDATGIVLRMLAPDAEAQATIRVREEGSLRVLDEYTFELAAMIPSEISLPGLAQGAYDIEVEATAPIVAAARQTQRDGGKQDFSWMLPAPALQGTVMFSVPSGAPATLYLRNTQDSPVTVTLDGADQRTVELQASDSATVRLRAGAYTLESESPVHAAVGMLNTSGTPAIAGWPLWPPAATQRPIVVHP